MKMNMKKINMVKVKEFLFDHGEKVGLGSCLFIALLLGLLGFVRARSAGVEDKSGKAWSVVFSEEAARIDQGIKSRKPDEPAPDLLPSLEVPFYKWDPVESRFAWVRPIHLFESGGGSKRDKPIVFPVREGPRPQIWQGLVLTHELNEGGNAVKVLQDAGDGGMMKPPVGIGGQPGAVYPYLRAAQPRRMVIGTFAFPMKQQVAEFVRALKMKNQTELFKGKEGEIGGEYLPKPMGYTLVRFETAPDGTIPAKPKFEVLVEYKHKEGPKLSKSVKEFLQTAIYDEKFAELIEPHAWMGLVMPTPQIAYGRLPRFDVPGIDIDWASLDDPKKEGPGGVVPKDRKKFFDFPKKGRENPPPLQPGKDPEPPAKEGKVGEITKKELNKSAPILAARLFENKFNVYHALGEMSAIAGAKMPFPEMFLGQGRQSTGRFFSAWEIKPKAKEDEGVPVVNPMPPPRVGDQPGQPGVAGPEVPDWDRDAIVRFIDPEVEPGKTYVYQIQVFLANPNYKKQALVAYDSLANDPVLAPSAWTKTAPVTIEPEYWLYAVDQQLLDDWANPPAKAEKPDPRLYAKDATTFQIHQWVKKHHDFTNRDDYMIGDWVVAERMLVRKGEFIGTGAVVEVPVWRKLRDSFDVPRTIKEIGKDKKTYLRSGIKLELSPEENARSAMPVLVDFNGGKKYSQGKEIEETAVDALIMTPDGQLLIYNSRDHAAIPERQKRVLETRLRTDELRSRPAGDAGGLMPGGGGAKGGGS